MRYATQSTTLVGHASTSKQKRDKIEARRTIMAKKNNGGSIAKEFGNSIKQGALIGVGVSLGIGSLIKKLLKGGKR